MIAVAVSATPDAAESFLKLKDNPQLYVFYLGHLFDLTPGSVLALREPLLLAGFSLGIALPLHWWIRKPEAKGIVLAVGMALFFVAADIAFLIFVPRMTSKVLAEEINRRDHDKPTIVIDGEYEEGSSLTFYTHQTVLILNGRSSDLEYGSYYPDAPHLFIDGAELKRLWAEPKRVFLLTFVTKQGRLGRTVPQAKYVLATYGDKLLISNQPD
jgi:hypothetical protein